jgi:hypothetical protein
LFAWLVLAGAIFVLLGDRDVAVATTAALAPAAIWFASWRTLRAAEGRARALRAGWWTVTLAGGVLATLLFLAHWEKMPPDISQALLVGFVAQALVVWLVWRRARHSGGVPVRSWLSDAAVALGCLAMLGIAGGWALDRHTARLEARALTLWAAIGRPMPEFERQFHAVEENPALAALLGDLQPLGIASLYKATEQFPGRDTLELPQDVLSLFASGGIAAADRMELPPDALPFLDAHADQLALLYQHILQREPAVWALDPADGPTVRVPNFLATRKCSQLFCADALRRFSRGDVAGARSAVEAGLRMSESLREQPLIVSVMIRTAVEALFAQAQVRLPAEEDAWEHLAADTASLREALQRSIQGDTILLARCAHRDYQPDLLSSGSLSRAILGIALPRWAERLAWRPLMRLEASRTSWINAEALRRMTRIETLHTDDLGAAAMERFYDDQHVSISAVNFTRAWTRLNGTLLLHEQTALIRSARAKLQSGVPGELAELPSNVIPGAQWKITLDRAAQTVTLRLENAPRWAMHSDVLGPEFYLLPLDGSRAWKLEPTPTPRTAAIQ